MYDRLARAGSSWLAIEQKFQHYQVTNDTNPIYPVNLWMDYLPLIFKFFSGTNSTKETKKYCSRL